MNYCQSEITFKRSWPPAMLLGSLLLLSASAVPAPIESGHSAMWYDPARSGEGWVLEMLDSGNALLYWYTYDESGNQRWLQGVGERVTDETGERLEFPELYSSSDRSAHGFNQS